MLWAADAPGGDTSVPFAGLLSYGALGAIFILAILGYVTFRPDVTRLERQNDALRKDFTDQIAAIRKDYTEQIAALRKDHTEQITAMRQERDRASQQRDAMAETFQKEWIPALVKSLGTVEALLPLMQRLVRKGEGGER